MTASTAVAVLGIGLYLPELVRSNDWWPQDVVEGWREKLSQTMPLSSGSLEQETPGVRASLQAIHELREDPFLGARERRVMPEGMVASDMEAQAARQALAAAGVEPAEIGVLLSHSMVPDYLAVNPAAILHAKLGLPERCFTVGCDGSYSSFLSQLATAAALLASGAARYALIVQS
ncbi:MAG TPA: hypothetical protein VIW92_09180, partial [Thermoanaerobaculia bacterium]